MSANAFVNHDWSSRSTVCILSHIAGWVESRKFWLCSLSELCLSIFFFQKQTARQYDKFACEKEEGHRVPDVNHAPLPTAFANSVSGASRVATSQVASDFQVLSTSRSRKFRKEWHVVVVSYCCMSTSDHHSFSIRCATECLSVWIFQWNPINVIPWNIWWRWQYRSFRLAFFLSWKSFWINGKRNPFDSRE